LPFIGCRARSKRKAGPRKKVAAERRAAPGEERRSPERNLGSTRAIIHQVACIIQGKQHRERLAVIKLERDRRALLFVTFVTSDLSKFRSSRNREEFSSSRIFKSEIFFVTAIFTCRRLLSLSPVTWLECSPEIVSVS
jgi:hypothetical protein